MKCPLNNCPKSDVTFGSDHAVVMHMLNTPVHTEVTNKREAYDALNDESPEGINDESSEGINDSSPGGVNDESPEEGESTPPTAADGSGPQRLELPTEGNAGETDDSDEDGCPECGSGKYDLVGDNLDRLQAEGYQTDHLQESDRICYECVVDREEYVIYRV